MLENLPRPTIFAHRGASAHAPENTLASFKLALQHGAPAIELDVKLSLDGEMVVIHDQTVDRTTDGTGRVNKLPLAALQALDAGFKFNPKYKGEKIPTLSEVFEEIGSQLFINIEITNYASPFDALPEKVAELVKHHGIQQSVLFSSFLGLNLRRAHSIVPDVPLGLLTDAGIQGRIARALFGSSSPYQAVHPEAGDITPHLIERFHRLNRRVHTYTVNDPSTMRRLFAWGIDGIFTDDPQTALQVLSESSASRT